LLNPPQEEDISKKYKKLQDKLGFNHENNFTYLLPPILEPIKKLDVEVKKEIQSEQV